MLFVSINHDRYGHEVINVSSVDPTTCDSDLIDSNSFDVAVPHNWISEAMRNIVFNVLQAGAPGQVIHSV